MEPKTSFKSSNVSQQAIKTDSALPARILEGHRVAILATDGFEKSELLEPREALLNAGARVDVVSLKAGEIKSWSHGEWSDSVPVDLTLMQAVAQDYQALVLPGGVLNPDSLRTQEEVIEFVREFLTSGRPIGAICHGPQVLIDTGLLRGRHLTSWPSLKADLRNAGASWTDREVIIDENLVTSRKPADIPAFNAALVEKIREFGEEKKSANLDPRHRKSHKVSPRDEKPLTPYI